MSNEQAVNFDKNLEMRIAMWYNKLLFQIPFHDKKERK